MVVLLAVAYVLVVAVIVAVIGAAFLLLVRAEVWRTSRSRFELLDDNRFWRKDAYRKPEDGEPGPPEAQ